GGRSLALAPRRRGERPRGASATARASGRARQAGRRRRMSTTATETAYYVFGVVAAAAATRLPDRHDVSLVVSGELAAISGVVSLAEFGEDPLRENLNDRTWLEAKARAHE